MRVIAVLDWRTVALGLVVFAGVFAGGLWLDAGRLLPQFGHAVDAIRASAWSSVQASVPPRPGITKDAALREIVIRRANAYLRPVCYDNARALYVRAASEFASELMRTAGCNRAPSCRIGERALDEVWRRNRSARDADVGTAMAMAHRAGGLSDRDFRGGVGLAVRVIAGTDFSPGPAPACSARRSRSWGRWLASLRRH